MAWNETTETEIFDLDAAVAAHVERTQQETRRREEQEAYEAEVSARRGRVEARQRLEAALPAIVRETLRLGEPIYHNGSVEVRLTINDEPWTLWASDSSTWSMYAPDEVRRVAEDAELLDGLVAAVADYRERSVNRAIAEREEAEKRLRQAEEHHKIEREIEDAKTKAAAALWQWPEDVALTLFKWSWQRGRDEDGSGDYDDAWSAEEDLDPNGWLPLADGRVIKLIPSVHLPVVGRHCVTSAKELPHDLRREVRIFIPDVSTSLTYSDEGDHCISRYVRSEGSRSSVSVGYEPVAWVRAMLADDTVPGSAPQPEPLGADLPTLTDPAFDLPF